MPFTSKQKEEAFAFYEEAITLLNESRIAYMLGGAYAMFHYTGILRDTKDLDVFCKSIDCPGILNFFEKKGFRTEFTDARWLAKVFKGDYFMDVIFDSTNNICTVDDTWFQYAVKAKFNSMDINVLSPEELVWGKIYVQNRERYDGADVNHIILKYGKKMDWKRLLTRLDPHWHILLAQIIIFQFVYPSEYYEIIPKWLFDELIYRANLQYETPFPVEKVCRGLIIDQTQYSIDIKEWNYKGSTIKTI